jgi:tetraacyldisaccharide 4'-kinase
MKTPTHWNKINLTSIILSPIGLLYGIATKLRLKYKKSYKVSVPVICVGNLTAGGTGKTPVSISIASILQQQNLTPFFVSRGYGGNLKNIMVDSSIHTPQQCGDEPLLLARQAPVIVNPDRFAGADTAIKNGADIIIMDDGFQNPKLHKDLSFLVFDGSFGVGNELCIPAGPLRENIKDGLKRAQAIIIIGEDKHQLQQRFNLPCFLGSIKPLPQNNDNPNVMAFAGIGNPQKFYNSLKECGFNLLKTYDFPDHHYYNETELQNMINTAKQQNTLLYTTSKDFVKIPAHLQKYFKVLEITIEWKNPQYLTDFILKQLKK